MLDMYNSCWIRLCNYLRFALKNLLPMRTLQKPRSEAYLPSRSIFFTS